MEKYTVKEIEPLKKLNCIKRMGDRYIEIWIHLVEHYAPQLNEGPLIRKTAYTKHDFSHHCKDIYAIIDNVLLKNVELQEEEYFVLAVAVLLHDISMTQEHFDRLRHSEQSADYVQKESNERVWKEVPIQDVPIIKELIIAHSDIKERDAEGKEIISQYTLRTISDKKNGEMGNEIQVKWLAGILRLADELDVTNSRTGNADNRFRGLELEDKDENKSYNCWEYLNYFKEVVKDRTTIDLVLNEQYLISKIDDNRVDIIENIKNIRKKIERCIEEVNEYAFDNCEEYYNKIKIKRIKISDPNCILTEEELYETNDIKNYVEKSFQPATSSGNIVALTNDSKIEDKKNREDEQKKDKDNILGEPVYLNSKLGESITRFIYDNELIFYGHYRLNRRFCGVDWVDVRSVLSNNKISTEIVQTVVNDLEEVLSKQNRQDILIIGISMNGNILASRTAFQLDLPFSYLIPTKPGTVGTEMEKTFKLGNCKKVVLFTGVISSYDTITNMIKENMPDVEIIRIYTVLWRKIALKYSLSEELETIRKNIADKVVCLNKDFPCEILSAEKCLRAKYGQCVARNEQAYEEIYEWPLAVKDKKNNRVFINNIIGCDLSCRYCYLYDIGILKKEEHTADEVIAEFERLHDVVPERDIISIGCYAECMSEDNLLNMERLINYFAVKGFYIQISTKKGIPYEWIRKVNAVLKFENQLNIFVSLPTINCSKHFEPQADDIKKRVASFEYTNYSNKIKFYIYIKPFLEDATNEDTREYIDLIKNYGLDIVVGNKFQFHSQEGNFTNVGKNEMYEEESGKIEGFINSLQGYNKVYRHSTDPIREIMEKKK